MRMDAVQEVKKYVDDINAAGGNAQVFVYPGEGHAFMNKQSDSLGRMKSASLQPLLLLPSPQIQAILKRWAAEVKVFNCG